jgi:hypothetical protein
MKPLVLTGFPVPDVTNSGFADLEVSFFHHFIWGPLPSEDELAAYLGPAALDQDRGTHWSDFAHNWKQSENKEHRDLGLAEFCLQYETVELWFDTRPYAQLQLAWLLDHFSSYPETVARLKLRMLTFDLIGLHPGEFKSANPPITDVSEHELEVGSSVWQAYLEPTPEACVALLREDLSSLPSLKPALRDLLDELPSASTGLGANEMRMLELIGWGCTNVNPLFHFGQLRRTRVFNEWELGYLLDGLAFGPKPTIEGLDEELRTIKRDNLRDRHKAMLRSRFSLPRFGRAVLAHRQDFSRHNPIDRWWGGTHLTNEQLWRYGPVLRKPRKARA